MLSMPPATNTSALPASSWSWPSISACMPEPHILFNVVHCAAWLRPAPSAAWRARGPALAGLQHAAHQHGIHRLGREAGALQGGANGGGAQFGGGQAGQVTESDRPWGYGRR